MSSPNLWLGLALTLTTLPCQVARTPELTAVDPDDSGTLQPIQHLAAQLMWSMHNKGPKHLPAAQYLLPISVTALRLHRLVRRVTAIVWSVEGGLGASPMGN
jgi:hypothetical protein